MQEDFELIQPSDVQGWTLESHPLPYELVGVRSFHADGKHAWDQIANTVDQTVLVSLLEGDTRHRLLGIHVGQTALLQRSNRSSTVENFPEDAHYGVHNIASLPSYDDGDVVGSFYANPAHDLQQVTVRLEQRERSRKNTYYIGREELRVILEHGNVDARLFAALLLVRGKIGDLHLAECSIGKQSMRAILDTPRFEIAQTQCMTKQAALGIVHMAVEWKSATSDYRAAALRVENGSPKGTAAPGMSLPILKGKNGVQEDCAGLVQIRRPFAYAGLHGRKGWEIPGGLCGRQQEFAEEFGPSSITREVLLPSTIANPRTEGYAIDASCVEIESPDFGRQNLDATERQMVRRWIRLSDVYRKIRTGDIQDGRTMAMLLMRELLQ
jgi:hypothetical protein